MNKLYLDDLKPGDRFETGEHALDAAQIVAFAKQFDPQPFHLDDELAKRTFFRGLAASGWHTAAITMRLLVTSGVPLADGIIGARNEEQLRQNLGAVGWNLTPAQVAKLDAASKRPAPYPYWHQHGFTERNPLPV